MRRAPTRPQNPLLSSVRVLLASAALALPVTAAQAQIEDASPRWVVITQDATPVRCDDFERFYKVATLDTGAVLRTDGQSKQWARVIYPVGVPALAPAADVRVIDDKTVELTTPSRLRAPSAILGIAGSWRSLYSEAIPAGTRLEVIEKEIGANDEVAAYRVKAPRPPVAPEPPYAYIKLDSVRDATSAEADAHIRALSAIPGASHAPIETAKIIPDAVEISGDEPAEQIADQADDAIAQREEITPAPIETASTETAQTQTNSDVIELTDDAITSIEDAAQPITKSASDASDSLLEPMVLPGQEDASSVNSEWIEGGINPVPEAAAENLDAPTTSGEFEPVLTETTTTSPEIITQGGAEAQPVLEPVSEPELAPEPASIEDLEQALVAARRLPREALDEALDELHAEFQRTLSAEQGKGQDEKVLDALRRRVAWLDLRIETRDQRRALDAALAQASTSEQAFSSELRTWQAGRSYSMVGRLAPSAIYNGDRLPLMYRVQSIDPLTGPRTIGYLRPAQGERLDNRLGQIVGIIGSATDDDALSLRIIQPERVDVLDSSAFANAPIQ